MPTNPYVLAVVLAVALGYYTVEAVKVPVVRVSKGICRVVTLGHKCTPVPVHP